MFDSIESFSEAATGMAEELFGVELDYSEKSLEHVEDILDQIWNSLSRKGIGKLFGKVKDLSEVWDWLSLVSMMFSDDQDTSSRGSPSDDDLWVMSKVWGSYIGKVIEDRWGGEWGEPMEVGNHTAMTLNVSGIKIVPTVKVYKRLTNGPEDNILVYYKVLSSKFQERKE